MGVDIRTWRIKIGTFVQPRKHRSASKTLYISGRVVLSAVRVSLVLSLLILLCGDVESNPGPPKHSRKTGKPVLSADLPDYHQSLSRKLFKVMEDIGASTEIRDLRVEKNTLHEILSSWPFDVEQNISSYICGSQFEGSTTLGMQSDIDMLNVKEFLPVVVDTRGAQQYNTCVLMFQDFSTPAGYAKLQLVINGIALSVNSVTLPPLSQDLFIGDREGRPVLNWTPFYDKIYAFLNLERHGPAGTVLIPGRPAGDADLVEALRCRRWPDCATEWITRERRHNWPGPALFNKCKSLGFFLVKVGHQNSDEKDLEYRISFSLQERLLVTHFNSTQLKCFILLKLLKKGIIRPLLKEETITSYHCKTCVLYMVENTPAGFWIPENLLKCLQSCLKLILIWSANGICPNYFIPAENMFDGRLNAPLRVRLCHVLQMILSSDFKFLLQLRSDDLGTRLETLIATPSMNTEWLPRDTLELDLKLGMVHTSLQQVRERRISLLGVKPSILNDMSGLKQKLLQTEQITEHTREETQRAVSLLLPHIDLLLMSELIVSAKREQKPAAVIFEDLMSDKWQEISSKSDSFSARLKQANYLYSLGYQSVSLDILKSLEDKIHQNVISLCCCPLLGRLTFQDSMNPSLTVDEMLKHHVIPCFEFLPAEIDLTPPAICYEMRRQCSAGDRLSVRSDVDASAVFDGKILLYFLLYLNHRALGMEEEHARADIENLHRVIDTDPDLNHEATDLNLLGWIYKEMGCVDKATECFNRSLAIVPKTAAIQAADALFRRTRNICSLRKEFLR